MQLRHSNGHGDSRGIAMKKRKAVEQHHRDAGGEKRKRSAGKNVECVANFTRGIGHRNGSYGYGTSSISSSVTIHASQYARRVSAPNHKAIPTPGYRLVSEIEDEDEQPRARKRPSSSGNFPDTFYARGSFVSPPEPPVNRAQRQREIYSYLLRTSGPSTRSVLQEKWDVLNTHLGLRLQFSEAFFVVFPRDFEVMQRSLALGRRFLVWASHAIMQRKRKMLENASRVERQPQRVRLLEGLPDREPELPPQASELPLMSEDESGDEDEPTSSGNGEESVIHRGGAKCWTGWMQESARRASRKYNRARPITRGRKKKPVRKRVVRKRRRKLYAPPETDSEDEEMEEPEDETEYEPEFEPESEPEFEGELEREPEPEAEPEPEPEWTRQKSVCKSVGKVAYTRILDRSCVCNVLFIEFDRGWREYGGAVELTTGTRGKNCALAILLMGETIHTQEIRNSTVEYTTNEHTGSHMWAGDGGWMLEFKHTSQFTAFKKLHEKCFENNYNATVKSLETARREVQTTTPKFRLVRGLDTRWRGPAFIRPPNEYITSDSIDMDSQVLYDMDAEDEAWLAKINGRAGMYKLRISEHKFEKVIYTLEKYSHDRNELLTTFDSATEVCLHVASLKIIKLIHKYWLKKRQEKGKSLVRHFQPELPRKRPAETGTSPTSGVTAVETPEQANSPEQQAAAMADQAAPPPPPQEPEQLVFKKFTGRASLQEQKRLRVMKQLQQAGIKHFRRVPPLPPALKPEEQAVITVSSEETDEEARDLQALANAAMLENNPPPSKRLRVRLRVSVPEPEHSTPDPSRGDSEGAAAAASENDQEADSTAELLRGLKEKVDATAELLRGLKAKVVELDVGGRSELQVPAPVSPPVEDRVVTSKRRPKSRKKQPAQVEESEPRSRRKQPSRVEEPEPKSRKRQPSRAAEEPEPKRQLSRAAEESEPPKSRTRQPSRAEEPDPKSRKKQPAASSRAHVSDPKSKKAVSSRAEDLQPVVEEEAGPSGKVVGELGIVLRPRKDRPTEDLEGSKKRKRGSGNKMIEKMMEKKEKKFKSWSAEIRKAMGKIRKCNKQMQLKEQQLKKSNEPLSIKRIPRMNARFSSLLTLVVADTSSKRKKKRTY